jgi:hypothetical protein
MFFLFARSANSKKMKNKIEKSRGAAKPRELIRQEVHRDGNWTLSYKDQIPVDNRCSNAFFLGGILTQHSIGTIRKWNTINT